MSRTDTRVTEMRVAEVVLRDGRRVTLRPIRPDDRQRYIEFFNGLDPRTRYLRFQSAKDSVTEQEIDHFTRVSPPENCAYVATLGSGEDEQIIGLGRWEAAPGNRSAAVTFTVEDRVQNAGIGTMLLEHLATAASGFGFEQFEAQVLAENTAMQGVFEDSGFTFRKRLADGQFKYQIDLRQTESFNERRAHREHTARAAGVRHLLRPKSIAVIGASRNPRSPGGAIFRNLIRGGFNGPVFPVNRSASSVAGVLAYPGVADVPGDVDLAVVVVPAKQVADVIDDCARKGIWGLVVISAGFGEVAGEGIALEKELREKVLSYGGRLIGPNCLGILNMHPDVSMNATFAPNAPPHGRVSMGSQSGALGIALLDYASSINLGVAEFVSFGNRADISPNDLLQHWEDDPNTGLILLYLESFGNPRKFSRIARRVTREKPIIAVKAGRTAAGSRAASSHTGSLAGSDIAADALFDQAGVIRAESIEEMFGAAQVLAYQPAPKGDRVAIITNAGGPGILAADACESRGLEIAELGEQTRARLRGFLAPEASVANPVDVIAAASADHYKKALEIVLADPDVDAVLLIYIPPLVTEPDEVASAVREAVVKSDVEKPVIACFMMSRGSPANLRIGPDQHIPSFTYPEDAVKALARAREYYRHKEEPAGRVPEFSGLKRNEAESLLNNAKSELPDDGGWLYPEQAVQLLGCYGITVAETSVALTEDEAAEVAERIGYPIAMKLRSRTIVHKSDVGGVRLGLQSPTLVRAAFREMVKRVSDAGLESGMEGVVIQRMASPGQEVIVGMTLDPTFGPLVMAGLGGVQVEMLRDVAFSLHPLTDLDPGRMLGQLKTLPLLTGWRGSTPRDVPALKEVLLRFSALVEDLPEIKEVEINPVVVFNEGDGCVALDARVRL